MALGRDLFALVTGCFIKGQSPCGAGALFGGSFPLALLGPLALHATHEPGKVRGQKGIYTLLTCSPPDLQGLCVL